MVSGGKNAALAVVPAALLADSPSVIENLPDINDIHVLLEMLHWLGADVSFQDNVLRIDPRPVNKYNLLSCAGVDGHFWARQSAAPRRLRHRGPAHRPDAQGHAHAGRAGGHAGRQSGSGGRRTHRHRYFPGHAVGGRDGEQHAHGGQRQRHHLYPQRGQRTAYCGFGQLPFGHGRVGEGRGHGCNSRARRPSPAWSQLHYYTRPD